MFQLMFCQLASYQYLSLQQYIQQAMGNQSHEKFQWDKNFNVLERNFNDHTLILEKMNGGQQYIGRELLSTDKKQQQQIKRLIKIKYHSNNPFLTKLQQVHHNSDQAYCSPQIKIYLVFLKPKQTLRQQILARKFANQPFTQQQADIILQSGAKAIRSLRQMNHPHNNVSTSSIFIDKDRKIILGDPWITPPAYNYGVNQNVFACPSPEKILLQNDQILTICPFRSDLFSLGTVVLEALNYEHMDILYEKGFRKLIEGKVKQKLNRVKNDELRYKLSIILSHDPQNRDEIYKFYRPSVHSTEQGRQKSRKKQQSQIKITNYRPSDIYNKGSPIAELSKQMLSYDKNPNERTKKTNYQQYGHNKINNPVPTNLGIYNKMQTKIPNSINTNGGFGDTYGLNHGRYENDYTKNSAMNTNSPYTGFNVLGNTHNYSNVNYAQYRINGTPTNLASGSPLINFNNIQNKVQNYQNFNTNDFKLNKNYSDTYKLPSYTSTFPSNQLGSKGNLTMDKNINNINMFKENKSATKINILDAQKNIHALDFNKKQNFGVLTRQQSQNNFEPVLIKTQDEFVKTSGNIRYIEAESNKQQNSGINYIHTGAYNIKTLPKIQSFHIPTSNVTEVKELPKQISKQENKLPIKTQETKDYVVINNEQEKIKSNKRSENAGNTPERKPNRKYNSTIKQQSEQRSYSGSRNEQDLYQYVIETYEAGRYEGQKFNNMRNGFGKFYYKEGSVYQGQWKDNLMHGKGNLYYSDGKLAYEGDWRMDQFHGHGKVYNQEQLQLKKMYDFTDFTDINQYWSSYQGELNSDRRHGKGRIKLSNGQIFVGNFVADTVEGQGKFYTLTGEIIQGIWRNNKLVKKL